MSSKFSEDSKSSKEEPEDEYYPDESKSDEPRAEAKDSKETKGTAMDEDEIVDKLQSYFFEDEFLSKYFEDFISAQCHIIDLTSDEYKLCYTEVFNDYKRQFEEKMEFYITHTLRCSIQDVYRALKVKTDSSEDSMGSFFAQILIAVTDFDVFMTVMREMAATRRPAEHK